MKLGIMQPYFFPYIGYFQLINATDKFVFFDTPQYERRGWMNRNRIINPDGDFTYISVPVKKAPQRTPINEMLINNDQQDWKEKILLQLEVYKKRAPYYKETCDFVERVLAEAGVSLVDINVASVVRSCEYIGMGIDWEVYSKMDLEVRSDCEPDEWALEITKAMSANHYINAPGGQSFFDKSKYDAAGIKLEFIQPELTPYVQRVGRFVPGLSIIDVMMYNTPEEIRQMMEKYTLSDGAVAADIAD